MAQIGVGEVEFDDEVADATTESDDFGLVGFELSQTASREGVSALRKE